jgi:diguanylate cyclase (GGDEF)-like protein
MRFEKTVFRAMLFVMLLAAGLTVFLPLAHASDSVLSFYQYYTLVVIVCLVRELVRATRRKHEDIWLFNFGTLLLAVSSINDILHFLRVIETGPISHFGLVVFIMFQSAILARRYSRLFFQYEHLNRNLGQLVEKKTEEMNLTIQALEHASVSDSLTGVRNRRYVYEILFPEAQALLQRWEFTEKFFGVLMLDIDHFKNINDTHGHEAGDRILKQFSSILTDCVRVDDLVVRWGGEEFLVILRDLKPVLLPDLANKIIRQVRSVEFRIADDDRHRLRMTASLGCCLFPFFSRRAEMISLAECIRIADLALYMAKRHGRDRGIMAEAGLQAAELADLSLLDGPEEGLAGKIIFRDGEHSPPV